MHHDAKQYYLWPLALVWVKLRKQVGKFPEEIGMRLTRDGAAKLVAQLQPVYIVASADAVLEQIARVGRVPLPICKGNSQATNMLLRVSTSYIYMTIYVISIMALT